MSKQIRKLSAYLVFAVLAPTGLAMADTYVGGTVVSNTTWTTPASPYIVTSDVVITQNATLTIEPGVVVKFADGTGMVVGPDNVIHVCNWPAYPQRGNYWIGSLVAQGAAGNPITFTSLSGVAGSWKGIVFDVYSDSNVYQSDGCGYVAGSSVMSYCVVEKAGQANKYGVSAGIHFKQTNKPNPDHCIVWYNTGHGVYLEQAPITISDCGSGPNGDDEIYIVNCSPQIINNQWESGSHYTVYCQDGVSNPTISGNTFFNGDPGTIRMGANTVLLENTYLVPGSYVEVFDGNVTSNRTWRLGLGEGVSYHVVSDVVITQNATLTIEPGVVVKFADGTGMVVGPDNVIHVCNWPAYPQRGNYWIGSLVAQGAAGNPITFTSLSGVAGSWKGIVFDVYSDSNVYQSDGCGYVAGSSVMSYCVVEKAGTPNGYGIGADVYYRSTSKPSLNSCWIRSSSGYGVYLYDSRTLQIHDCSFLGNNYGMFNAGTDIIDAANNFWGDPSGPSDPSTGVPDHNPNGTGEVVSDYVVYRPWLGAPSWYPGPLINLSPISFSFSAVQHGPGPSDQVLTLQNSGGGTLDWYIDEQIPWLDLDVWQGTSNYAEITVSINTTDLEPGTNTGEMTVTSTNADNSGITILVSYEVTDGNTLHLVYGPDQDDAGQPVPNAYVDIYRDGDLFDHLGPTDATGIVVPSDLGVDDEIFAYVIAGAGQTEKRLHPTIPAYIIPGSPDPGCVPLPWYALFFTYLDNQSVDGSGWLQKATFGEVGTTIALNHKIAKLDLVVGFDHPITPEDRPRLINLLQEQMGLFNRYFFDATNGAIMVNSVLALSNVNNSDHCDIVIRDRASRDGKEGEALMYYFLAGRSTYFDRQWDFERQDGKFYRALAHEIGHNFLLLGEEYRHADFTKWWCPSFLYNHYCNDNYPTHHASIMSNKSTTYDDITEFCHSGHSQNCDFHQNQINDGQSCWEFLSSGWYGFFDELEQCPNYQLGMRIPWTLPTGDYHAGPYIEVSQTTSHAVKFGFGGFEPSYTAKNMYVRVNFDYQDQGFDIFVTPLLKSQEALSSSVTNSRHLGHFGTDYIDSTILLYSIESGEAIMISSNTCFPITIAPDTVGNQVNLALAPLPLTERRMDYVSGEVSANGGSLTLDVHLIEPVAVPPELVVQQGSTVLASAPMIQVSDMVWRSSVLLDPAKDLAGQLVISCEETVQVLMCRWEVVEIAANAFHECRLLDSYSLAANTLSGAQDTYILLITNTLPTASGDYLGNRILPSPPVWLYPSRPLTQDDHLALGIAAGNGYTEDDPISIATVDPVTGDIEYQPVQLSGGQYFVYTMVESQGLYVLSLHAPTCCTGRVGDANGEGEYPDEVTLGDIMLLVDVKFISGDCTNLTCIAEADVNQDGGSVPTCDDNVTLGDIMVLVDHLFISNTPLKECL